MPVPTSSKHTGTIPVPVPVTQAQKNISCVKKIPVHRIQSGVPVLAYPTGTGIGQCFEQQRDYQYLFFLNLHMLACRFCSQDLGQICINGNSTIAPLFTDVQFTGTDTV